MQNQVNPYQNSTFSGCLTYGNSDLNAHNYQVFGVQLDGRTITAGISSSSHRFGFQGQEEDNEIKGEGNSLNYEFRMHDPRLGRFFAIDPLTSDYPWYTPYQFSGNKLIDHVELEGLEESKFDSSGSIYFVGKGVDKKSYNHGTRGLAGFLYFPVVAVDAFVTKGWLSRAIVLHELGSEINATDRYHEAKANGNEQEARRQKEKMEAHGPGSFFGPIVEVAPLAISEIMLSKRIDLATKWMGSANKTKYVDFTKPVYTKTVKEGTELTQFRVKGSEGTIGDYFAPVGTKPGQIGLDPSDVVETLTLKVTADTKVLVSTHTKNATYYANESVILEGAGTQYYSRSLKNNVKKTNSE